MVYVSAGFAEIQWMAQFGALGAFSGLVLYVWRRSDAEWGKRYQELHDRLLASRKESEDRYAKLVEDLRVTIKESTETMRDLVYSRRANN